MAQVHASSAIDPRAELADDVQVGPCCVLEGAIVLGAGTRLLGHVYLQGPLRVGRANVFYPFCCVGFAPQDRKFDPAVPGAGVSLGDGNVLREGVTIHRATGDRPTAVGDRNYLMVNAHLGHDVVLGNDCLLANGALLGGHVHLEDQVILGGNAGVHQFCRLGRLSMLSGGAGVTQDLPPFCTCYTTRQVGSLNLVGLRRAGLRAHIEPLKQAFDILYRRGHARRRAVELIESGLGDDPLCLELVRFVRSSRRGLTSYHGAAPTGVEGD